MKFTKMHGLGNDYVFVPLFDQRIDDPAALARAVSDRRTGIGADGLILIDPSKVAAVRMVMYNADGSRAQMCGNGLRCVAKYAYERRLIGGPEISVETDAGVRLTRCNLVGDRVASVTADMGRPSLTASAIPAALSAGRVVNHPLDVGGMTITITCVSMGNPHAVAFLGDLDDLELQKTGPAVERAAVFPERINAHFVRVDSPSRVTMKTWERGSGATRACGSGACAVCVAGALTGRTERAITASMPGGDLDVSWADDDHVYMTGPAVEVFSGVW